MVKVFRVGRGIIEVCVRRNGSRQGMVLSGGGGLGRGVFMIVFRRRACVF